MDVNRLGTAKSSMSSIQARRTFKPGIPVIGQHGIEMHDEIDLALALSRDRMRPDPAPVSRAL